MKDEIKEILDRIKKHYVLDEKQDKLLFNYITNLQEENKDLSRMCELYSKSLYNAELTNYKSRNEKAKSLTNRTIEIIKQQPSGNDEWILERLNGINYCLGGDE